MPQEIKTITLGGVNCYLVRTGDGFVLVDSGFANKRVALQRELAGTGCQPGNLKLIVVTHGDFDHSGNCAYLREKYGVKIAMHRDESEAVEKGDLLLSRKVKPVLTRIIYRLALRIVMIFLRSGKFDKFKPDLYVDDGYDLSGYSFNAKVVHIPGHTRGSIGVLTASGELFCGDLLTNRKRPTVNPLTDDRAAAKASVEKLEK